METRRVVRPRLLRREDLLELRFEFINLVLVTREGQDAHLARQNAELTAYVIVNFPPQGIEEEAFFETTPANEQSPAASNPTPGGNQPKPDPDATLPLPNQGPPREPPVRSRIAGYSRLVFTIPPEIEQIPYTVEGLLNWAEWQPSLAPVALPPKPAPADLSPRPAIIEPQLRHTAIEFPYRLMISPNRLAHWVHAAKPVTYDGRTELWHTRLGILRSEADDDAPPANRLIHEDNDPNRTIRAIWSQDFNPDYDEQPDNAPKSPGLMGIGLDFRAPLSPNDRHQLVRLTSDFNIWTGGLNLPIADNPNVIGNAPNLGNIADNPAGPGNAVDIGPIDDIIIPRGSFYDPVPVDVEQLMLTSQGAWGHLRGAWDDDDISVVTRAERDLTITSWRHVATQGRDHYVRVVYAGYAYPIRHAMSLIKVTERKFQTVPGTTKVAAYLRQRMLVVFRELVRDYTDAGLYVNGHQGRDMPLHRVRVLTRVSPNIQPPENHAIAGTNGAFWIHVEPDSPFHFQFLGTDRHGAQVDMSGGLIFVPVNLLDEAGALTAVRNAYASANRSTRKIFVPGQSVAFAPTFKTPQGDNHEGTTALETQGLYFTTLALNFPQFIPPWTPVLHADVAAEVKVPAADQVAGSQGTHDIRLYQKYLNAAQNDATIFAEMVSKKAIALAADQAGGLATPSVNMGGLSQHLGPVAGTLDNLANGSFDPKDFFNGISAKLLGGIDLFDIVASLVGGGVDIGGFSAQFPKMRSLPEPPPPQIPDLIRTSLSWQPKVMVPTPSYIPIKTNGNTTLVIDVEYVQYVNSTTTPAIKVNGDLSDFDLNFAGIINIHFNQLRFLKEDNKKLDVHVDIPSDGIRFDGALKFLNELEDYLKPGQFMDPPSLSVSPSGVTVGYSLELPPLAVGVLTLQNIALGAQLTIPFGDDSVRVRFNLSERHDPFRLAVMIFAGGGFFALTLGAGGMEVLEIALEFGGSLELDIGVASGGVSVMAGIYFKLENKQQMVDGKNVKVFSIQFTAYIRLNGHVSVLGIISISIEFYLSLTYKEITVGSVKKSKLEGEATVTVEVEVLFFSATVSMTVRRRLSGSADDPTFSDMFALDEWAAYGLAFA